MNPVSSSVFLVALSVVAAVILFPFLSSDLAAAWSAISLKHTRMLWHIFPQYAHFSNFSVFSGLTLSLVLFGQQISCSCHLVS